MKLTIKKLKQLIKEELNRINEEEMTPEQAMEQLEELPAFGKYMILLGQHMHDDVEAGKELHDLELEIDEKRDYLSQGKDAAWVERFDELYDMRTDLF